MEKRPHRHNVDALKAYRERELHIRNERRTVLELSLDSLIRSNYPQLTNSSIPDTICYLIKAIEPFCEKGAMTEKEYFKESRPAAISLRGSGVKRHLLGTPLGYWDISPKFLDMADPQVKNPINRVDVHKVLEKLRFGPMDLDMVYKLAPGQEHSDIFLALEQGLDKIGYQKTDSNFRIEKQKYERKESTFEKGDEKIVLLSYQKGDNSKGELIHFNQIRFFRGGKFVFKVDIVNMPKDQQQDFRYSVFMPGFDLLPRGWLKTKGRKKVLRVSMPKDLKYVSGFKRKDKSQYVLNEFFSRLRAVGNGCFWPVKKRDGRHYDLSEMIRELERNGLLERLDLFADPSFINLELIGQRLPDIVSEFMTYLSYDPFLFLKLAYTAELFNVIPFGNYIGSQGALKKIMAYMIQEMEKKPGYKNTTSLTLSHRFNIDETGTSSDVSKYYREHILQNPESKAEDLGPFMFMRAFNKYLLETSLDGMAFEETIEDFVTLLDPRRRLDAPSPIDLADGED